MTECDIFNRKNIIDSCLLNTGACMSVPALYPWWLHLIDEEWLLRHDVHLLPDSHPI